MPDLICPKGALHAEGCKICPHAVRHANRTTKYQTNIYPAWCKDKHPLREQCPPCIEVPDE